ncbi:IPT/TIG domain-containing protein [Flagellimonas oceani]|nr:IPT/TIG domain-containing protein [Allomuricauda oceani]
MFMFLGLIGTLFTACSSDDDGGDGPDPGPGETELTITAIEPATARIGETVTITGTGFSDVDSQNKVYFYGTHQGGYGTNDEIATLISAGPTQLVVEVHRDAQTGPITIVVGEEKIASESDFTLDTSLSDPEIVSLSANDGFSGNMITIIGVNFTDVNEQVVPKVYFGEIEATVESFSGEITYPDVDSEITVFIPDGLPEGETTITVQVNEKISNAVSFMINATPVDVKTVYWTADGGVYKGTITDTGAQIDLLFGESGGKGVVLDISNQNIYWLQNGSIYYGSISGGVANILIGTDDLISTGAFNDLVLDETNQYLYVSGFEDTIVGGSKAVIFRINLSNLSHELIFEDESSGFDDASGVKLSNDGSKLFYANSYGGKVGVINLNGLSHSANILFSFDNDLFETGEVEALPANIALDETNGKIYVIDKGAEFGLSNAIYIGNIDGTGELTEVVSHSEIIYQEDYEVPYDIEIDTENEFIFWCTYTGLANGPIKRAGLDGSNVEVLFTGVEEAAYFVLEID